MEPSKDQVVHDLTIACVNGMIQAKVIEDSKNEYPCLTASDLAAEAVCAYKDSYNMINMSIKINDK